MEMTEKRPYIKMTEQTFTNVKFMLNGGATIATCAEAFGVGKTAVGFAKKADSYKEYKEMMLAQSAGHKKKIARQKAELEKANEKAEVIADAPVQVVEHRQSVIVQATHYMESEIKKQTELLTLINNKLTLIAEDLGCFREDKKVSNL